MRDIGDHSRILIVFTLEGFVDLRNRKREFEIEGEIEL